MIGVIRAIWRGVVLAESNECIEVEGNQYFPPASINTEFLRESPRTTICPWKGQAHYYDVIVGGEINEAAAWYYPEPKPMAVKLGIRGYIAFWKDVKVVG